MRSKILIFISCSAKYELLNFYHLRKVLSLHIHFYTNEYIHKTLEYHHKYLSNFQSTSLSRILLQYLSIYLFTENITNKFQHAFLKTSSARDLGGIANSGSPLIPIKSFLQSNVNVYSSSQPSKTEIFL